MNYNKKEKEMKSVMERKAEIFDLSEKYHLTMMEAERLKQIIDGKRKELDKVRNEEPERR